MSDPPTPRPVLVLLEGQVSPGSTLLSSATDTGWHVRQKGQMAEGFMDVPGEDFGAARPES